MGKRKTIDVSDLVDIVNTMSACGDASADFTGVYVLLDTALHRTGQYRGFQFRGDSDTHGQRHAPESRRHYYGGKA